MMTLMQINDAISKEIGEIVERLDLPEDYTVVVCPERIFMDDYLPKENEYYLKRSEMPFDDYDSPNESPYRNHIFVVVKMGTGQRNEAVSESSVTLQVLSEQDDFLIARTILDQFIAEYNFKLTADGFVQAYFNPEVIASQETVYTGFRALMTTRGFIRVPEPGVVFVTGVIISIDGGETYFRIPYMGLRYNHNAQPDPQAFAGTMGNTMTMNRQASQTISFDTYLTQSSEKTPLDAFSSKVFLADRHINAIFDIALVTNVDPEDAYDEDSVMSPIVDGEDTDLVVIGKGQYRLVSASYSQDLGDMSTWSLTFSRATREEN